MLRMTVLIAGLLFCVIMVKGRPRTHQNFDIHLERLFRRSCNKSQSSKLFKKNCLSLNNVPRLNSLKKSVYNFLETKLHKLNKNQQNELHKLNKSQQIVVANALITKFFKLRRKPKNSHNPRNRIEDMFARML